MKRALTITAGVLAGWLGSVSLSEAQVFIRAPFVRVAVGDGVSVRAPFVNLYVPPSGPVYYPGEVFYGPRVFVAPPQPLLTRPMPAANEPFVPPMPQPANPQPANRLPNGPESSIPIIPVDPDAPQPVQPATGLTLEAFAKSFKPKAGSYDVTMINPITKQPTPVRFTLPEGTPRRVIVERDEIEFSYGLRHFVRIHFDRDGAIVTSR